LAAAIPRVYDYDFSYNPITRHFAATLTRSVSFEGSPLVFAEDVEVKSTGAYVVSESISGALWVIRTDGTIDFGLLPVTGVPIPILAPCEFLPTTVGGIPFATAGNFAESLHGLAFNRFSSTDRWLYAADSLQLGVVRINTADGSRQVVVADPVLFNFPSKLQFLPPVAGLTPQVVASDQEHRLAAINAAITADITQPPWIVTKIHLFGRGATGVQAGADGSK